MQNTYQVVMFELGDKGAQEISQQFVTHKKFVLLKSDITKRIQLGEAKYSITERRKFSQVSALFGNREIIVLDLIKL